MRIALAAEGTRGDIHPLLGLAERWKRAGHEIRVCAPPDFADEVTARGLAFHPVGVSVRDYLTAHAAVLADRPAALIAESHRYMRDAVAAQFEALPAATEGCDWIVAGGVQAAAASCAELHGAAYRYVIYCPALLPSREHPPFMVPWQRWPGWANRAAWRTLLPALSFSLGRIANRGRRNMGLPKVRNTFLHWVGERPILAVDAALGPCPPDVPFPVEQIPCLHPARPEPLPAKLADFLAAGPPPVYFGFGSMPDVSASQTLATILAAVEAAGCRALVSEGWAGLGGGALPSDVMQVGTVSHPALFRRVAAVVHHGGAGTTTSAARAGAPQIIVPHVLDQYFWGHRVHALGLGPPPLPRRRLRVEHLAPLLQATLDNELLAERAACVARQMADEADIDRAAHALLQA